MRLVINKFNIWTSLLTLFLAASAVFLWWLIVVLLHLSQYLFQQSNMIMNLYSLINNYETSNKYTKYLNTYAHLFKVVATIIQVRGLIILCVKY
jgi:hypothetical protein